MPWLVLFACALLAAQGPVARLVARRGGASGGEVPAPLWVGQFLISVYGGYFGAGIGILMLAAMAILVPSTLQHANALKVLLAALINGISALYFLVVRAAHLPEAGLMAAAAVAGGYAGARLAQRMRPGLMRLLVIAYGVVVGLSLMNA